MNNEYMKNYMLKRYHARRNEAIEYLGGECVSCNSKEDLELDHIKPDLKSFNISKLWSCSISKFREELNKCQLLCKFCHSNKSILEAGKKIAKGFHETVSTYRYCKCEACKKAKAECFQKWKQKKLMGS